MRKSMTVAALCALLSGAAMAQEFSMPTTRTGLGQASPMEPAQIKNLRLSDPLVQQKYLNEPDMLRFLRGTYAEACTRGLVKGAADSIRYDKNSSYSVEQKEAARRLVESNKVWKLTSSEMEAFLGGGYLNAANYCDCVMKEVADQDLVNPRKGLEVIDKLPKTALQACEQNAKDLTTRQLAARKKVK